MLTLSGKHVGAKLHWKTKKLGEPPKMLILSRKHLGAKRHYGNHITSEGNHPIIMIEGNVVATPMCSLFEIMDESKLM